MNNNVRFPLTIKIFFTSKLSKSDLKILSDMENKYQLYKETYFITFPAELLP